MKDNKVIIQARSAVAAVLKKYRVSWREMNQNNALIAWQSLAGVWKNKNTPNVLKWQRQIRKEWDRKILNG